MFFSLFFLFFLRTVETYFFMMLTVSCKLNLNLIFFPHSSLPIARDLLCEHWAGYFSEYSQSTLHSSVECLGPCNKHVLSPVSTLLRWPSYFLHFLERPLSGLIGEVDSTPLHIFLWPAGLESSWLGFLRCFPFVYLFNHFHYLKHIVGFPMCPNLEFLILEISLISPDGRKGVDQYFIQMFRFLRVVRSREKRGVCWVSLVVWRLFSSGVYEVSSLCNSLWNFSCNGC